MDLIPRILGLITATLLLVAVESMDYIGSAPQPATTTTTTTVTGVSSFPSVTTQPPTTTTIPNGQCGQWWGLALELGWQPEHMETLDYIMWRESRCDPTQHNTTLNKDGSTDIGLTQINDRSWCLPTRWYPSGYLQSVGVLSTVGCEQLFDPRTNLLAAKAIHDYHTSQGQRGFEAWEI